MTVQTKKCEGAEALTTGKRQQEQQADLQMSLRHEQQGEQQEKEQLEQQHRQQQEEQVVHAAFVGGEKG